IIYWLIAQEKLNFPRGMGVRMPLSRYQEPIIVAINSPYLTIKDINIRTDTGMNKEFNGGGFKKYQCGEDLPRNISLEDLIIPNQILRNIEALR
ncbi:MAG: hypothetical protein KBT36_02995, partial [Kurthia sp.]|nr:hypothetical protein [Candidatus Kurthia equi]